MTETRKLAAILAADVVGFSRLAGTDEDRTLARLRALRSDLIDPTIAVHHGRVVKRTGDGALVEFRSVVDAVRCAIEVQNGMVERNAGLPPERRIEFRIGIHLGDVVEESDGDLMGDGVNIAARLEGIAKPGAICLSEDAYRQVKARLDLTVSDLGATQLKNIAEPIRVYSLEVGVPAEAKPSAHAEPAAPEKPSMQLTLPDKPSIAVLPFQNMSGDPEQEYFADGMVEDIITGLSRIKWLFVIARNSSFVYKGKAVDVKQVGRDLGVRYVLEGSVRKAGGRVRITGQLIEAETGTHLWADKFDGALDDVFDLQDRITTSVVGVVEPSLRQAEIERARRKRPDSLGAYDLYLRAVPYFQSIMPAEANIGIGLLEEALKLDPNYAAAHAYMAWGMEIRVLRGGYQRGRRDRRRAPCSVGISLRHRRRDDAWHYGVSYLASRPRFRGGVRRYRPCALAERSCAAAFYWGAHIHAFSGDPAIAEDYANRALRLSPFDPFSFNTYLALGLVGVRDRRYDDAAACLAKAVQTNPRFSTLYAFYAAALAMASRIDESKSVARQLLELEPGFRIQPFVAYCEFARPEVVDWLAEGLRKSGLSE